ncbi:hypothetical protein [Botrimarina mediterranea]|uniref:Chromosome partition protein Smc n=1 Tax=Botrimarina mediterranea TaxID=2528022 RepID=A0A518K298_9BACT|nr:hypothetical protein [Botrimarina mediterranea]QDV71889.1 hypothetical protein Spa11_00580 [Botrimarina mediterranea]
MTDQKANTPKQTTKYSITAAHRITGKSRTTIQKHIKKGKLSYTEDDDGNKVIDASELMRVYGDECDFSREEGDDAPEEVADVSGSVRTELHTLREKLNTLAEERRRERDQLQAQIDHLQETLKLAQEGSNRALLLLENRSGGGEWREAIAKLEKQLEDREDKAITKAKEETRREFLSKPWWRLLRG